MHGSEEGIGAAGVLPNNIVIKENTDAILNSVRIPQRRRKTNKKERARAMQRGRFSPPRVHGTQRSAVA